MKIKYYDVHLYEGKDTDYLWAHVIRRRVQRMASSLWHDSLVISMLD